MTDFTRSRFHHSIAETDIAASQAKLATLEDEMDLAVQRAGAAKQQRIDDDAVEGQQLAYVNVWE